MTDQQPQSPRSRPLGVDACPRLDQDSFDFDEFTRSMRKTTRNRPYPVEIIVRPWFFDETWRARQREGIEEPEGPIDDDSLDDREELSISLVVTGIRPVFHPVEDADPNDECFQDPEFEVEGWLNPPGKPETKEWVILYLKTSGTDELTEASMYLLNPGEECGTERTPGVL